MKVFDPHAHFLVQKSRTRMIVHQPWFGHLSTSLRLREVVGSPVVKTMATDGTRLYYNPDWVRERVQAEGFGTIITVTAHETLHNALGHTWRRGNRHPELWNIACDIVVNLMLKEAGFQMPSCAVMDDQFFGMSAEHIYSILADQLRNGETPKCIKTLVKQAKAKKEQDEEEKKSGKCQQQQESDDGESDDSSDPNDGDQSDSDNCDQSGGQSAGSDDESEDSEGGKSSSSCETDGDDSDLDDEGEDSESGQEGDSGKQGDSEKPSSSPGEAQDSPDSDSSSDDSSGGSEKGSGEQPGASGGDQDGDDSEGSGDSDSEWDDPYKDLDGISDLLDTGKMIDPRSLEEEEIEDKSNPDGEGDDNKEPDPMDEGPDLTETDWQSKAALSLEITENTYGNTPAGVEGVLKQARARRRDVWEVLHRFIENCVPRDWSWMKPNKRFIGGGTYLPGIIRENLPRIIVGVDTSGSMFWGPGINILKQVNQHLTTIIHEYRPEALIVYYCDADIQKVEEYSPDDPKVDIDLSYLDDFSFYGGGGTSCDPVFDAIEKDHTPLYGPPACCIYFTDLEVPRPRKPDYPVLWVTSAKIDIPPPFGDLVQLPDPDELVLAR